MYGRLAKKIEEVDFLAAAFADFIFRQAVGTEVQRETAAFTAAIASRQLSAGHICIDLNHGADFYVHRLELGEAGNMLPEPMKNKEDWKAALLASNIAALNSGSRPLVIEPDTDKLYLQRYWSYERLIAERLISMASCENKISEELKEAMSVLFPHKAAVLQKQAAEAALRNRLSVITGGPGTGKTSTAAKIIFLKLLAEPESLCALTAPTGKAAARMGEAVSMEAENIRMSLAEKGMLSGKAEKALDRMAALKGSSLHRLLGTRKGSPDFVHNADNPLPYDFLAADEASMIDAALMAKLLSAIPDTASFMLLGDGRQLSAVEAGSVFGDICGAKRKDPCGGTSSAGLSISVLTHNWRSVKEISELAAVVSNESKYGEAAKAEELKAFFADSRHSAAELVHPSGQSVIRQFKDVLLGAWESFVAEEDVGRALASINLFRILSPLRKGRTGVEELNLQAEELLQKENIVCRNIPIMIAQNAYQLGLFNGDTGILRRESGRLIAYFEDTGRTDGGLRRFGASALPQYEIVFAMTVHKSQGSEFDTVLLIVPEEESPVVTRELLYTGITRAKNKLIICGREKDMARAALNPAESFSGLGERLRKL